MGLPSEVIKFYTIFEWYLILKQDLTSDIEMILFVVCIRPAMSFIIPPQTDVDFTHLVEHKRTPT